MTPIPRFCPLLFTLLCCAVPVGAQAKPTDLLEHELSVRLEPSTHHIEVVDHIVLPASLRTRARSGIRLRLHGGLTLASRSKGLRVEVVGSKNEHGKAGINDSAKGRAFVVREYRLVLEPGADASRLALAYEGTIHDPLTREEEYARSFSRTSGIISADGVLLAASSWWVPSFGDALCRFRLSVDLPLGWDAVSQGKRTLHEQKDGRQLTTWDCPHPMDEVYLIAAKFHEYQRPAGKVLAQAFLRSPDPKLAAKYLEATAQYLEMYRQLIGPYPYSKFALVENFWETGYGMPSFTLLGSRVIRFPFILHSSYPHEILHNWWGNSVFVDYKSGNWCEGLTAYLADHLIKEGHGKGAEYRRDSLKRYRNYVRAGNDFPLTEFRSRHSSATEAVGYGKCLMLFHMLRRKLGDALFVRGLASFYRDFRYKRASFNDIQSVFSGVAKRDLAPFFDQWVRRTGAPELAIGQVDAHQSEGQWLCSLTLRQVQKQAPYDIDVPIRIQIEGQKEALTKTLSVQKRELHTTIRVPGPIAAIQVDPGFDVFRRLHRFEIPPAISQIFGAERLLIILPEHDALGSAWNKVAEAWTRSGAAKVEVRRESELEELPADRSVWVLGRTNRWAKGVPERLARYGASVGANWLDFGAAKVPTHQHSFVAVLRHPKNPDAALGWIGSDTAAALPGLARKLPHYGKYSFLAFEGSEPANDAKGSWPAIDSPLVRYLGKGKPGAAPLPSAEPLARLAPVFDANRLMSHVRFLAADELEGRGVGSEGLTKAGDYIARAFRDAGLEPAGDEHGWFHTWRQPNGPGGKTATLRNVVGVLRGTSPAFDGQSVVLGAHYDHLGRGWPDVRHGQEGKIHNGADDNASGVAVLIEVARLLASAGPPGRTIVFVAFSGEEWGLKGSREHLRWMQAWPADKVLAMINLDTVGRLGKGKLQVLGTGSASEWIHINMGIGFTTGVESQSIAEDVGGSDQKSFVEAGIPAVQIFSGGNADYHSPTDDVDKIDAAGLVKVATFVREAVAYLSDRDKPLTSKLRPGQAEARPAASRGRRVSLGTMPDFAFEGPGVRVAKVMPKSAAAKAGLRDGDLIQAINGKKVADLRGYSDLLKTFAPGDRIQIQLTRKGKKLKLEATLASR